MMEKYAKSLNIHISNKREEKSIKGKYLETKLTLPVIGDIKPISLSTLKKDGVLLPYLTYSKQQRKAKLKDRLKISVRDTYKTDYEELRKRLHVDDHVDDCRCITDYDGTFFNCVKGNLTSNYVVPYKSLKHIYNSQLRWRQEVGYRYDCILNIERNFEKERVIYDDGIINYMKQVKYLDDFISADYKKSISFLNEWDKVKNAVDKKKLELQYLASEIFTMTAKILGLDYKYGLQQKYGRFLYYLSPPSWRSKNRNFAKSVEIEAKGFDFGISNEEDTFNVIFENLKRECKSGLIKPVLYFEQPNDLLAIFDGIEQQELNHFSHVVRLAPQAGYLKKGIKLFKYILNQDSAGILAVIMEFEKRLQFYEEQRLQLEGKFYKILTGLFFETVAAPDVLKLQLHLEFSYTKLYNEKPMNLDLMGTAKALENYYMDISKRLECVTSNSIKAAITQSVISERNKFRNAKIAGKELRQFERLERALLRAFAPLHTNKSFTSQSNVKQPMRRK